MGWDHTTLSNLV